MVNAEIFPPNYREMRAVSGEIKGRTKRGEGMPKPGVENDNRQPERKQRHEGAYFIAEKILLDFKISQNGRQPNINEAVSIFKDMQKALGEVVFMDRAFLEEKRVLEDGFFETGKKIKMEVDDLGDTKIAEFDVVIMPDGRYRLVDAKGSKFAREIQSK